MTTILKFLNDWLDITIGGLISIFNGILEIFNLPKYFKLFGQYGKDFNWWQWLVAIVMLIIIIVLLVAVVFLISYYAKKIARLRSKDVSNQDLIDEIAALNHEIVQMSKEKDKILGLKISQYGLKDGEAVLYDEEGNPIFNEDANKGMLADGESRFYKLAEVDQEYENYQPPEFDTTISLQDLCDRLRNFACSQHQLYYDIRIIRLYIAALATTRLIILQGISGTGKTSLPYVAGKFFQNDVTIASVQPSWRDRTELFGYFNEFTKRFNETELLKRMYEATYTNDVYFAILDEMNISRVEYYFAELLSVYEMPTHDKWVIDIVPSGWPNDPKHLDKGSFRLPDNMWFVGTANNDDSTFAISDKVYDRAIPININAKGQAFDAPMTEPLRVDYHHLVEMFDKAKVDHAVSQDTLDKIEKLDDYVIEHFRLAFGNRIVKQLNEFVPAYVACGGTELDGIDYVLTNKILRKFESLNLSYIRDEVDGLIEFINKLFGQENMKESKEFLENLKKLF